MPPRMPPAKKMADLYGHVVEKIRVKTRNFH
jgi:error-prone DNA polymerase